MFEHLLEKRDLYTKDGKGRLRDYGLDDDDIKFIKEQILGTNKYDEKVMSLMGNKILFLVVL